MKKLIYSLFALLLLSACSNDDPIDSWMRWSHENQSPEDIKYDYMLDALTKLYIEVNYKGGDITLICNNYDRLDPIGPGGTNTYDCGWGVFTVDGRTVRCHFPEDASGKPEAIDQITLSATKGNTVVNTILLVKRTFGELQPQPAELEDKYKFQLAYTGLMPFMNDDFTVPAPFDNLSFRVTDYLGRFQSLGFPEFTQHYDSIVWCAEGMPNTVRIYERSNTATSTHENFISQWSTHFFHAGEVKSSLKGYKGGEVVHSSSLTTRLYERDFLCYDWKDGSVVILNPGNTGIYCLLDTEYEYQASHTQELDGIRYAHINVWNKHAIPDAKFLEVKQQALIKLMAENLGKGVELPWSTGLFKCLPDKGVEELMFWENKTTRIVLVHDLPDEEYDREDYYLHFEEK